MAMENDGGLWFDVVFQYYTTLFALFTVLLLLWFDVVFQYYTTVKSSVLTRLWLWFDVVFQYYTTEELFGT